MLRETVIIQNNLGLHTRAAAKLVGLASRFDCQIQLERKDQLADCKNIMSIILLGAKKNSTLNLLISGADELEARDAILKLINNKFDEIE